MAHFDNNNILTPSMASIVVAPVNHRRKNEQIDAILFDLSKAFDKVSHTRLLMKLDNYGVIGKTLKRVQGFLADRTQRVVLEGSHSRTSLVTSGVPQGSVLGPPLFLAFINDLPSRVKFRTGMFADDCLLDRKIKNQDDARALKNDIDSLQVCEKEWQMEFNAAKCEVIRITTKRNPIIFPYQIHQTTLNATNQAKYIGVTIIPDLSWKCHIDNITKKP